MRCPGASATGEVTSLRYSIDAEQMQRLLTADWQTATEAIYVRDDLSVAEANRSALFRNVRMLLGALHERGGTKATAAGNLNRGFVAEMMEQLDLGRFTAEDIRKVNKVVYEEDVWELHIARVVAELAGLLRRHSGTFRIVQKRVHLLEDEQAGSLYRLLFLTFFRRFNLSYLDHMAETPLVKDTIPIPLFMVSRLMDDWVAVDEIAASLFLAQVREQIPVTHAAISLPRWLTAES